MDKNCFPCDLDAYIHWKTEAEKYGRTPMDIADEYERHGMSEYAGRLREIIEKMEAAL